MTRIKARHRLRLALFTVVLAMVFLVVCAFVGVSPPLICGYTGLLLTIYGIEVYGGKHG